jgi:hypothetical protein
MLNKRRKMAIIKCNCKHEFQDKKYGNGMRVHNYALKLRSNGGKPGYRCTICKNEKPLSASEIKGDK